MVKDLFCTLGRNVNVSYGEECVYEEDVPGGLGVEK